MSDPLARMRAMLAERLNLDLGPDAAVHEFGGCAPPPRPFLVLVDGPAAAEAVRIAAAAVHASPVVVVVDGPPPPSGRITLLGSAPAPRPDFVPGDLEAIAAAGVEVLLRRAA